ncbi:MAG: hypothetical protein ACR2PI_20715 [Hyphomicrobiaceae bacterium]
MIIRLSLCVLTIAFVSVMPPDASAQCEIGDIFCKKFSKPKNATKASPRRTKAKRRRRPSRRAAQSGSPKASAATTASTAASAAIVTSTLQRSVKVTAARPIPTLTRLRPGAIATAPARVSKLMFGAGDQVENVAGTCQPVDGSTRRVACTLAKHRLAMTSEAGAGCLGSLDLRQLTFAKDDDGRWINEDSIALCGGRLLRRSELFPVAIDGKPHYALREDYQMLGGDNKCAAPYLRTRQPLRKSYLPASSQVPTRLRCGTVASR